MNKLILSLVVPAFLISAPVPSNRDNVVIVPSLRGLVFVPSPKQIQSTAPTAPGVSVSGVPLLDDSDFRDDMSTYLGRPVTFKTLNEITSKVSSFYKQQNHPLVDVITPEQDVATGVIQIVVNEFRVGEVRVAGNRWFSSEVVSAPISLQHGDAIDTQKLLGELDAANANPFRHVDLLYQPGSQPGYTDLVLNTHDRFPVNVYTGFDNSGTAVTGRSRWNFGATWGNALWHDQQLAYQFSASDNFFSARNTLGASYTSNTLTWSMPVLGHDSVSILGSYQKSIPNVGDDFGLVGRSGQVGARYNHTLHRTSHFIQTLQFGYDFKSTNNNLAFGGSTVSRNTAEIDQFPLAYAANLTDHLGSSALTTSLVFSPGQLSPNNHTSDLQPGFGQSGIPGATARYTYWRTDFTRLTKLPENAVYAFRLIGQTSSTNLLYTEKLLAGGPDLLRGYDPNSVYGDRGIAMTNELRSPAYKPDPERGLGEVQVYAYWDYGHFMAAKNFPGALNSTNASSIGSGVRYGLRSNLTAHVNYGRALIQLPNTNSAARNSFTDIALTLAY